MSANQRSPMMEKADTLLVELGNLQTALGALADYISPYCTPASPDAERAKTDGGLEEAKAPLEMLLEEATAKACRLQGMVNDLIARLR